MIGCVGLLFDRMFEKLKDARYFNAERFTMFYSVDLNCGPFVIIEKNHFRILMQGLAYYNNNLESYRIDCFANI